ncbi:probable histone-lysine N-methyltransferase 2A at N-terminal half [Coccomyxa sp. Obi]|nr:probable histone-lysine N-methyltransferase 2A at N-terminal half [Coccomyxa sp. Obi]
MQSSSAGQQQQKNDVRMKKLLEEAATSLADTSEVLGRELSVTRKELGATKCSNTELEGKLASAERQITILEEALRQREAESRAAIEIENASAEKLATLRKRLEREKAVAVQEAEARWRARYGEFKRESVAVLANSASSLEAAEEEVKQLKEKLAAAEAGVIKEQQRSGKLARDCAQSKQDHRATAAQRDAAMRELEALKETLRSEVGGQREKVEREQREAEARVAAAEAEAAKLHVALATERQHAERAQQEAKLLAAQLEQNRGRLAMALAARDRADAECAAAKAERVAAERDREAAEKVLADVVVQLEELERHQEALPPPSQTQECLLPPPDAADPRPGTWDGQELLPNAADRGTQPTRFSRDPRLSAGTLAPADDGGAVDDTYTSALADLSDQADAAPGAVESPAQQEQQPAQEMHAIMTEQGPSAVGPQAVEEATCWLCQKGGGRQFRDLGPLMHLAINDKGTEMKWLHRQCLLWSPEVSEGRGSELVNVPKAVFRGRHINCKVCGKNGATLGCQVKSCRNSYHLPCALAKGCYLDDWRVWCPKHAPHIPSRVAAGPFSGLDLDSIRQDEANGNAEASGKEDGSKSHSAQDVDAAPAAAKRAASGLAARRKASSQPSSASAATTEAPPKPGTASAPAARKATAEQGPLRKAFSQPAQSAAGAPESMAAVAAAAKKQPVSAQATRRKAGSQKAVSTAATTTEAPKAGPVSAPAASRKTEPRVSPRRKADSQSASVSAAADTSSKAAPELAPQHKAASQPIDEAPEDAPASEQEVEFAETAPEVVADAAPALAEVAPAVEAGGSEPAATALQAGRRKKRKGIPVAAHVPGSVRLLPDAAPAKIRKVQRQPKAKLQRKAKSKAKAEKPAEQPATAFEPDQAPSSEQPDQAVGNEPDQATGDRADQAAPVEEPHQASGVDTDEVLVEDEPDQAMDEEPDETLVEDEPDQAMDEEPDEALLEEPDQAMVEEPDEAPASQQEPEPSSQGVSGAAAALGRSTGVIASMLGLQRWSRLAPKAAKQTAVLLAARGRHEGSSHGTASASAPSAGAIVSSAAGPSSSARAPCSSAAAPTSSTAPPASETDRSGFVGRLLDCLAEQEANPSVVPSVHPYQRKEAKRLEWGASSALPRLPDRRPKSAEMVDLPRPAAPRPEQPEQPLAPAPSAKKAAAAGKSPTSAAASPKKLAVDGRTGNIVLGVPVADTGAHARKKHRRKKPAATAPPADGSADANARVLLAGAAPYDFTVRSAGPAAEVRAAAAPGTGGPAADIRARAAPHSAPAGAGVHDDLHTRSDAAGKLDAEHTAHGDKDAAAAADSATATQPSSGGGKVRPARNRKAPERLATMPEGPQWLPSKAKKAAHQQALMANRVKSTADQGEARGQKRPAPSEVSAAAQQNVQMDGQQQRPAKKACNEPVGSPGTSRELQALQSAAAGLKALSNGEQGSRYTTRLASSSPEPQQPSTPRGARPKPAKSGKTGTAGTRTGKTPIKPYTGNNISSADAAAYDDKAQMLRDLMIRSREAAKKHHVELRKDSKVMALSADEVAAIVQRMRVQATLP